MKEKILRDPVHGDIKLGGIQQEVADTPDFQRLRGVRQLGTTHLIYPGATHTRFEHSLGTVWMARKLLKAIRRNQPDELQEILGDREEVLLLTALLHDITHVPFGHTFEDERRLFPRHDENKKRLDYFMTQSSVGEKLRQLGYLDDVSSCLRGGDGTTKWKKLTKSLVSGTVCADLLDYLRRDAMYCGIRQDYDERIFRYLRLHEGEAMFELDSGGRLRHDALSEIIHLLRLRYILTERVYYHHAKTASGAMISRALELAMDDGRFDPKELLELRDDAFLFRLCQVCEPGRGKALLDDLLSHRFYKPVYSLNLKALGLPGIGKKEVLKMEKKYHLDREQRSAAEKELAEELNVPEDEVIVYCHSSDMALKEASVPVLLDGKAQMLSDLELPEVKVLQDKHRALWRMTVYLRRSRMDQLEKKARRWCASHL